VSASRDCYQEPFGWLLAIVDAWRTKQIHGAGYKRGARPLRLVNALYSASRMRLYGGLDTWERAALDSACHVGRRKLGRCLSIDCKACEHERLLLVENAVAALAKGKRPHGFDTLTPAERIAIDERLGISGVPTNLEGRR
jgi:hypothetical protein